MNMQVWWRAIAVCLVMFASRGAYGAGGAYVVDDAAIGKPGECQVESWASHASNSHFIGATQPACVVRLGIPVEFTATFARAHSDAWTTFAGSQGKVVPLDADGIAIAFSAGSVFDVTDAESSFSFINVPLTIKVHDQLRVNLNAGGLWSKHSHFTWGAGFEWDMGQSLTLIAEVFGLTGPAEDPRLQVGLRHTPSKSVDLDLIYGNNITGEHAHWVTAGMTVRF